jgi:tight adherence protein B
MMVAVALAAVLLASAITISPQPRLDRVAHTGRAFAYRTATTRRVNAGGIAIVVVGLTWLPLQTILASVILLAAVWGRRRSSRRNRRRNRESDDLIAGLGVLVAELRIGAHPARAFTCAGAEVSGSVGVALCTVAARAHLGGDVEGGLRAVADASVISAHWRRLAVCWNLAHQHGLAVSHLVGAAARDIAERQRFTARLDASLAGARATASILAILPLFGVLLGQLIGAGPIELLLGGGAGGWLLVMGVVLAALGLAWANRIVDSLYVDGRIARPKRCRV